MPVTVNAVADGPDLDVTAATGSEDTAIPLTITAAETDTDGSETLSVTIADIPVGATLTLSDGSTFTASEGDQSVTIDGVDTDPTLLEGLTIQAPTDSDADFNLTVSSTSTDGTDTNTVSESLPVTVNAVADAPDLDVTAATGSEDTAIPLTITAAETDTDGSETLSVTIADIPVGATLTLSDGSTFTASEGDQSVTIDGVDTDPTLLEGLTIQAPTDSDADFNLTVSSTSTDGTDTNTVSESLPVTVNAVADAPDLDVTAASGNDDTAIPLTITAVETDTDGSETLSVTIADIPVGATLTLSDGTQFVATEGNTSVTIDGVDTDPTLLEGLTIQAPLDSDADFNLTVSSTSTDGTDTNTVSETLPVTVNAVADAPDLDVTAATGGEDTAIPLDIDAALTDLDGSETLSVEIADIPLGATITLVDGSTFTASEGNTSLTIDGIDPNQTQLDGLTITPPDDSNVDFNLSVTATATESNGETASIETTLNVDVVGVADAPTLTATIGDGTFTGGNITAFPHDLSNVVLYMQDDNGDITKVKIDGFPDGATQDVNDIDISAFLQQNYPDMEVVAVTVKAGDNHTPGFGPGEGELFIIDGTLTQADLPVADHADAEFDFDDAVAGIVPGAFDTGGSETEFPLTITSALTDTDSSETLSISVAGLPDGATLSAGYVNPDGSVSLTPAELEGLTLTVPADSDAQFDLQVTATSTENDGDTETTVANIQVGTDTEASDPSLEVQDAAGSEDTAIALDIAAALTDLDGSESLSVEISEIPDGAILTLSDGVVITPTNGSITLHDDQLSGLTITPPSDSNVEFDLTITATATEANGETASVTSTLPVEVTGVADAPTVGINVGDPVFIEGAGDPIEITINSGNVTSGDAGFTVGARSINPDGTLSDASTDNLSFQSNPPGFGVSGSASGADSELGFNSSLDVSEEIVVTFDDPVATANVAFAWQHSGEDATVELYRDGVKVGEATVTGVTDNVDDPVTFTADDGGTFDSIVFSAPGQGDDYLINSIDFTTANDGQDLVEYPIDIQAALTDTDGSESLSVELGGIPDGAVLTLADGSVVDVNNGAATIDTDQLTGITLQVSGDTNQTFDLTVTATTVEDDSTSTATTSATTEVDVDVDVEGATLDTVNAAGDEDTAIALEIDTALIDTDGSETVSIEIGGIPDGSLLASGGVAIDVTNGVATLSEAQLEGLTVTPPSDSGDDFQLTVTATTTESLSGETAQSSATMDVTVNAVADEAEISATNESGLEDGWIQLHMDAALTDVDGSKTMSIEITGVPDGAILNPGIEIGDGVWTATALQLPTICILPPEDFSGDMNLSLIATTSEDENGDTAVVSEDFVVSVEAVADAPTLDADDASGDENSAIALDIAAAVTDIDQSESLSVELSGIPDGASLALADGTALAIVDGSATIDGSDLEGITITPPVDSDTDFTLDVTAIATEPNGDTASVTDTISVQVFDVDGGPDLTVTDAQGNEDTAIALDIAAAFSGGSTSEQVMFVMDESSDSILKVLADGTVEVLVSEDDITAATGESGANLHDRGLSIDDSGNVYFTDEDSDSILMKPADGGPVQIVTSESDIEAATGGSHADPQDMTLGSDGMLYINDDDTDSIVQVNPVTGAVQVLVSGDALEALTGISNVDLDGGITASADGKLYAASDGSPDAIFEIDIATGEASVVADNGPWTDLEGYITMAPNGNLVVTDQGTDAVYEVDPATGETSVLITSAQITAVTGKSHADLQAGLSFDSDGNLYLAEEDSDHVLKFPVDATTGEINADAGEIFVDKSDMKTATGSSPDLEGAIAFADIITDSETVSIEISDIPEGASIAVNGVAIDVTDGIAELTSDQLQGLTVTPPEDSDQDFTLTVTATGTDAEGNEASSMATLDVTVNAVADDPSLTVTETVNASPDVTDQVIVGLDAAETLSGGAGDDTIDGGAGDDVIFGDNGILDVTAIAELDIAASLGDLDGSESLAIEISGIPNGATLARADGSEITVTNGSAAVTQSDLTGLTIATSAVASTFALTVTATATEDSGGATSSTTATIDVTVEDFDGASNDVLDGGVGDDQVFGGAGTDTLNFTLSEVTSGDVYDGGTGTDTLVVTLTAADLSDADVISDLTALQEFIENNVDASTDTGVSETFDEIQLTVSDIEAIQFIDENGNTVSLPGFEAPTVTGVVDQSLSGTSEEVEHTLETTNDFPVISAGVALDSGDINGVNMTDMTLANDHPVTISFESESAGYQNSLGYYKLDEDGNITDVQFVWTNASDTELNSGDTATLDVGGGDQFALFIVADGAGNNDFSQMENGSFEFRNADGSPATADSVDPQLVFVGTDGSVTSLAGDVFHTAGQGNQVNLNSDGEQHAVSGIDTISGELMIGFEDLNRDGNSDDDFNDLIISLDIGTATARELDAASIASNIDLADVDSAELISATIIIAGGFQDGDSIDLPDGALNGSGVTITSAAYDAETGSYKLELSGDATVQAYEDILSAVQFDTDGNGNTDPGTRSIQFQVTDSSGLVSNVAQIDLDVAFEAEAQTIIGGGGDDTLVGGSGDDFLDGKGGDDILDGGAGDDTIEGGGSDDLIYGGSGDDVITGEGGEDTIYGQDGADQLTGSSSADFLDGGAGNDTIIGDSGNDEIYGGDGDDWVEGGANNDIIFGGLGEDSIFGDSGDDLINGGDGNDYLEGGDKEDFLIGGDGDDTLVGGSHDDVLFGGEGNDTIEIDGEDYAHGGSGDDLFQIDADDLKDDIQGDGVRLDAYDETTAAAANAADGSEIDLNDVSHAGIDGGSGNDTLQINAASDTTINLGEGNYEDMVDSINNIEAIDLTGGDGNITLGLDSDDIIKLTDDDNELDIILGEGDEVDFGDGEDQPVEGFNDDGSTSFTYFDDGGNMMAKINIRDDTDNTGT